MTARTIFDSHREVGVAVWLFLLYWQNHSPDANSEWLVVGNGRASRDSESAKVLKISVQTATRWRRRLRDAGLIQSVARQGGGFQIWLLNLNCVSATEPSNRKVWPEMQTELVQ
jgi:hypothetical protein